MYGLIILEGTKLSGSAHVFGGLAFSTSGEVGAYQYSLGNLQLLTPSPPLDPFITEQLLHGVVINTNHLEESVVRAETLDCFWKAWPWNLKAYMLKGSVT